MSNSSMFDMLRAMDAFTARDGDDIADSADCLAEADYARLAQHPVDATTASERRARIRHWMHARKVARALALIIRLAPALRSGSTVSEALAAESASAARARYELRDADGRVCCSECGTPHDDATWAEWYPDPLCRPDNDELLCASCAFGGE